MFDGIYNWLTTDQIGLSFFNFGKSCFFLIVIMHIMTRWMLPRLFSVLNKGMGTHGAIHVWPELEKGNVAVAIYYGLRVFGVLVALGTIAARFIGG